VSIVQQAFLLPANAGDRFCVWRAPVADEVRGVVVHVPAFAEEMNKSRRMTAWMARELAAKGFGVLQIDLHGCGDSTGDFGDATWDAWVEDIGVAVAWVRRHADAPLWLWAHRAGSLLACAALRTIEARPSLLLWQPVMSGRQYLTQFLRMKLAAEMLSEAGGRSRIKQLREELASGRTLEVAGYRLSSALAGGLDAAEVALEGAAVAHVAWIEVGSDGSALSPAAEARVDALRAQGVSIDARAVRGPPFWHTVDIEDCPELVAASLAAVRVEAQRDVSRASVLL
jgi:exosortase A-associated hydrolase 2